jgi:hypothetical protein
VLSQVSDLADLRGDELRKVRALIKEVIETIEEHYDSAKELVSHSLFLRLGLGDAGIAAVSAKDILILTTDLDLWYGLQQLGLDAINFNHIRPWAWKQIYSP